MTALSLLILLILAGGVLTLPRNWAAVCVLAGTLYLAQGAALQFAGLTFFPTRLLGYLCLLRVLVRGEFSFAQCNKVDKALLLLYAYTTLILLIRADGTPALRLAKFSDAVAMYFAFRAFVRTPEELRWLLNVLLVLLVPYVALLAVERFLGQNYFVLLGHHGKTWLREGTPRCFGSFGHPSLLGSLGGCFLPLFVALAWDPAVRRRAVVGAVLCVAVVGFSNSGGPISVLAAAVAGWLLWPMRTRMQTFRRGLLAFIILVAIFMKAPIWYLPAKLSSITGGTGWHRSRLMEVAYRELDQWWLAGMATEGTRGWLPYNLSATGGADITNQFLAFGLQGGLFAIAIAIVLFVRGFSLVGKALVRLREHGRPGADEALLWGLGVAMVTHIFNWIGITYYDQFYALWLLQLAALVSVSEHVLQQPAAEPVDEPVAEADWLGTAPSRMPAPTPWADGAAGQPTPAWGGPTGPQH